MKKVLALILVLAMAFAFTGCGEKSEDTTTDNAGITEISVGEGLPAFTFENPKYEQALPDESNKNLTHYYTSDAEGKIPGCAIFEFDKENKTLEEYTVALAEEYEACWEVSQFDGVDCGYLMSSYDLDGTWTYDQSWIFEAEDKYVIFTIYLQTYEIPIGDSSFNIWIPNFYEEFAIPEDSHYKLAGYEFVTNNKALKPLAPFTIETLNWLDNEYEYQVKYCEEEGKDISYTKEQFEAWQAEGWTLDEVKALFEGEDEITDQVFFTKDKDGFDGWVFEENHDDENGVPQTTVRIIIADGDKFYALVFRTAKEDWTQQGHAFATAIHSNK